MTSTSDLEKQRPPVPALLGLSALAAAGSDRALQPTSAPSRLRRAGSLPFLPSIQSVGRSVAGLLSSRRARQSREVLEDVASQKPSSAEQAGGATTTSSTRESDVLEPHRVSKGLNLGRAVHERGQLPRKQELELLAASLIHEVYQDHLPSDAQRDIQSACPEVAWLAECVLRCPLRANWGKVWRSSQHTSWLHPFYVGPQGDLSESPPHLPDFASLAWCVIWARLRPSSANEMAKQLGSKTKDLGRKVNSLRECWTGPHVDPTSHEDFFYCGAAGVRLSQNPCQELSFVFQCAKLLQHSGAFSAARSQQTQDVAENHELSSQNPQAGPKLVPEVSKKHKVPQKNVLIGSAKKENVSPWHSQRSRSTGHLIISSNLPHDVDFNIAARASAWKLSQTPQEAAASCSAHKRFCPPSRGSSKVTLDPVKLARLETLDLSLAGAQAKAASVMAQRSALPLPARPGVQ